MDNRDSGALRAKSVRGYGSLKEDASSASTSTPSRSRRHHDELDPVGYDQMASENPLSSADLRELSSAVSSPIQNRSTSLTLAPCPCCAFSLFHQEAIQVLVPQRLRRAIHRAARPSSPPRGCRVHDTSRLHPGVPTPRVAETIRSRPRQRPSPTVEDQILELAGPVASAGFRVGGTKATSYSRPLSPERCPAHSRPCREFLSVSPAIGVQDEKAAA